MDAADVPDDLHAVTDLDAFIAEHKDEAEEYFVIGGGMVYKQMLPHCSKLYLTEVNASDDEADTFFPEFDKSNYVETVLGHGEDDGITYDHVLYERK
jgi:dihydrofolate reductase